MFSKSRLRLGLLGLLIFVNWIVWLAVSEAAVPGLRVDFLDVGQGDAILIRTPTRQNILVDGGPDDQVLTELGKVLPLWDREINLVVATHLDADHITGLLAVLQRYQVDEVLTLPINSATTIATALQQALFSIPTVNYADATDDYQWGGVVWDTLWPLAGTDTSTGNNNSIVAQLRYQETKLLLTGDIEKTTETSLRQLYPDLLTSILKVAHHGSKSSSGADWLAAVQPRVAVISVGRNSYGHPHPDTLMRLQAISAVVYRTDQDGTIEVIFGDNGYWIKANRQKKFYQN